MNEKEQLKKINNEIKIYINESNFISKKCRNKIIKILGEEFSIDLDVGNYASIDVVLTNDGNIIMRDDLYKSSDNIDSFEEVITRYERFKEKADTIISKKDVNFYNKGDKNNILNILILVIIFIAFILLLIFGIKSFLIGDYFDCIWLILFISYFIIPKFGGNLSNRIEMAKSFIKRKSK